jgi:glycosyltransferase involved in cell wall biosynthesis
MIRLRANGATVFSMGDMIEYTPGSRNDLFFWPLDLSGFHSLSVSSAESEKVQNGALRVVHAPNHREFKGTRFLEAAVADLQSEGVAIELVMVEKMPNSEAMAIYRTADVVFDQCLIGFHGYFALEAMALGKPVMCFIRKPDQYLIEPNECPIINTSVHTLRDDLRQLVQTREKLVEIGKRGRVYVERHYSRAAFAGRLRRAYQDLGIN